ncbi:MAG TPA: type II secretion system F family protein [Candidatus Gastranaerophilales bacterium]|nr:type II secretion system F family protein [Candidatus Gastranaerophilales bacterium]
MEFISTLILISVIIFIIYEEFFAEEKDDSITRRLKEYSPVLTEEEKQKKEEQDSATFIKDALKKLSQNVANKSRNVLAEKQTLAEAGMSSDDDSFIGHISKKLMYAFICGAMGVTLAMLTSVSPMNKLMLILFFPLLGFRFPDMKIKKIAKQRAEEVTYTLPDAIDLLSVCVEAGLGIDSAISRVANEQETSAPVLSQEFKRVGKDIITGISRSDALKALAKRNGSVELRSFVGLLVQSDRLGTSISQSLKVYSDSLRVKRRQRAEELASKASIKMTIPLVLFILPATFIVILTPAALSILKIFTQGSE